VTDLTPNSPVPNAVSSSRTEDPPIREDYLGIPFIDWLTLFLDYAVVLATAGKRGESYQVCEAARDCVAFKTVDFSFLILVASCGTYSPW
jgi:hypothetical protein